MLSRYSPTSIPVLAGDRALRTTPQSLKQESDPLLLERVLTRCRYNEAMTPKPRRFRGSRSFLQDPSYGTARQDGGGSEQSASGNGDQSSHENASENAQDQVPQGDPSGGSTPPPQSAAITVQTSDPAGNMQGAINIGQSSLTGTAPQSNVNVVQVQMGGPALAQPPPPQSKSESEKTVHDEVRNQGAEPALESMVEPSKKNMDHSSQKVLTAPTPSYLVAATDYLVVSDNESQSFSLSQCESALDEKAVAKINNPDDDDFYWLQQPEGEPVTLSQAEGNEPGFSNLPGGIFVEKEKPAVSEGLSMIDRETGLLDLDKLQNRFVRQSSLAREKVEPADSTVAKQDVGELPKEEPAADAKEQGKGKFGRFTKDKNQGLKESESNEQLPGKNDKSGRLSRPIDRFTPDGAKITPARKASSMIVAVAGIAAVVLFVGWFALTKVGASKNPDTGTASGGTDAAAEDSDGGALGLNRRWHVTMYVEDPGKGPVVAQEFDVPIEHLGRSLNGGSKDAIGAFTISGEVNRGGQTLAFQKEYDPKTGISWPIVFSGTISRGENGQIAFGDFFWRQSGGKPRIKGSWEATPQSSRPAAPAQPTSGQAPAPAPTPTN